MVLLLLFAGCGTHVPSESVADNNHIQSSAVAESDDIPDSSSSLLSQNPISSNSSYNSALSESSSVESQEDIPFPSTEEKSPITVGEWTNRMMKENGISNYSDYELAVYQLDRQIYETLDDNIYGGTSIIGKTYAGDNGNNSFFTTGIRVYYVQYGKVKNAVDECLKKYDSSLGKVEIAFEPCKYSLNDLYQFKAEIEQEFTTNPALKKAVGHFDTMINDGIIVIYVKQGISELEDYLKKVSFSECVSIVDNSAPIPPA